VSTRNRHLIAITEAHEPVDAPACLGKRRYETIGAASASGNEPYHCPWCGGWHTSKHGLKGKRRIGRRH
jgi:hypothetical protein